MYASYYGLDAKPFSITPDPSTFYLSPDHQEALTHLEYGMLRKIGLMMLTGDIGTGKTTILRYAVENFCDDKQIAAIYQTNVSPKELFRLVLSAFEIDIRNEEHKDQQLEALKRFLKQKQHNEDQAMIIIDECQGLSDDTLEEVRLLTNIQMDHPEALQILMVGQPEFLERLQSSRWKSLGQRIGVSYHIKPLDFPQTCWYISHRLACVGGKLKLFSKEALKKVYDSSGGIPRLINLICDAALIYGYGDELKIIKAKLIDKVVKERSGMGFDNYQIPQTNSIAVPSTGGEVDNQFSKRLDVIEEALVQIHNQLEYQREDITILSTDSNKDLQSLVQSILSKERRKRKYLEDEIKQMKIALKKAGIPYSVNKKKVSDTIESSTDLFQEYTQHLSVK